MPEILRKARELISDPTHWTQKAFARGPDGRSVDDSDPRACSWCSLGALIKVTGENFPRGELVLERAVRELHPGIDTASIVRFNDTRSHSEVLAVWDRAIEIEQSRGRHPLTFGAEFVLP